MPLQKTRWLQTGKSWSNLSHQISTSVVIDNTTASLCCLFLLSSPISPSVSLSLSRSLSFCSVDSHISLMSVLWFCSYWLNCHNADQEVLCSLFLFKRPYCKWQCLVLLPYSKNINGLIPGANWGLVCMYIVVYMFFLFSRICTKTNPMNTLKNILCTKYIHAMPNWQVLLTFFFVMRLFNNKNLYKKTPKPAWVVHNVTILLIGCPNIEQEGRVRNR